MPRQKKQHLKRRKDGRYCCKYHGIQFMGTSEEEALALRDEYKRQEAAGEFKRKRKDFHDYAMQRMTDYKAHLTNRTYNSQVSIPNHTTSIAFVRLLSLCFMPGFEKAKRWQWRKALHTTTDICKQLVYGGLFSSLNRLIFIVPESSFSCILSVSRSERNR